ncbi:MAG: hypothetical protein IH586_18705, partial [Anaerolineaceae bacterium]|nr:hypothetical protein [Anaerolineaceae bacterium]
MQKTRRTIIIILFALLLASLACQIGGSRPQSPTTPDDPAQQVNPDQPARTVETSVTENQIGQGGLVLRSPAAGLEALVEYRQIFSSTLNGTYKGQPYAYSETVERIVSAADETSKVEASTNGEALYLFTARLGETLYTQQAAGQPCRAAPAGEKQPAINPARKLPPVNGAVFQLNETLGSTPAAYYTFDQSAIRSQAGKNGKATGKLWVTEQGGAVLKYELVVQVADGDFTGERTWRYELLPADPSSPPGSLTQVLPQGCQPLLLDFPTLPGAQNVQNQP